MINEFFDFMNKSSKSVFHAVSEIEKKLIENGFTKLKENEKWDLNPKGKYFIKRNDTSLISFIIPEHIENIKGFNIVASHTDSPCLKIKTETAFNLQNGKIQTETYGGAILSTWLDRPLSIAGKIYYRDNGKIKSTLIDFEEPIGIIPNLAIHLNRKINKGFEYNKQNHLNPVVTSDFSDTNSFNKYFESKFNINPAEILSADLYLYDIQKPCVLGLNKDMFSTAKTDNLAMCYATLKSINSTENPESVAMSVWFDNEEIGSKTPQGADSSFLNNILERVILSLFDDKEKYFTAIANSIIISADGVHGLHPNFPDKSDNSYSPGINKGVAVKFNANQRYSTTAETAAFFIELCEKAEVPYQQFMNRSDIPSGSTIGPLSAANTGIKTVDAGIPMLAMHSVRELAGVKDLQDMVKVINEFYKVNSG